jgi:malonyl CoA-acyl carrier protein transacylase
MSHKKKEAIAVVGLGGCFPGATDVQSFWENIVAGHVAISSVPVERWDPRLFYSTDRQAPEKTYSQIGGFIEKVRFDPKKFRIPPKSLESVDDIQKLALSAVADALDDAGLEVFGGKTPKGPGQRPFDRDRTAVILGNSMGGEFEDLSSLRVWFAKARDTLEKTQGFQELAQDAKTKILEEYESLYKAVLPPITGDTMPGELSNCIAGRVANCFDLRGPNFTTDAACAASMAAVSTAVQGLRAGTYDLAIAGGVDRSMDPPTYTKFSKIGALSPDHSVPFDARANGFVMGEGAGILVLKRLSDAHRDGDKVYAVVTSFGASSDGRGKGMTAPNPRGQRLALERAYSVSGIPIESVGLFEAHGTSTVVGDSTELNVLTELLKNSGAPAKSIPIGSVKSMIGHLKSAAGAAALIKTALALHHKTLPPSAGFKEAPKNSPLEEGYLKVSTVAKPWESKGPRRAGVSAFGFGGTNFHLVLEEAPEPGADVEARDGGHGDEATFGPKLFAFAGSSVEEVLVGAQAKLEATTNWSAAPAPQKIDPGQARLVFCAQDLDEAKRKTHDAGRRRARMLVAQGIFLDDGKTDFSNDEVAFIFPGQGSQYPGMFKDLAAIYPIVRETFAQADAILMPNINAKLTDFIWPDLEKTDPKEAALMLQRTEICQPAMLTSDVAMYRLLHSFGVKPNRVAGHSLGEYAALVAAGVLSFKDALYAVSNRGKEMAAVKVEDTGKMAMVAAGAERVEPLLERVAGYVIAANKNSRNQTVIAGASDAVVDAIGLCREAKLEAREIPVSHAFHSQIVAPASEPLRRVLSQLNLGVPQLPLSANIDAQYYGASRQDILRRMVSQMASPVEFIGQIEKLHADGVRVFVEVGPRRANTGFVRNILEDKAHVAIATNHHKKPAVDVLYEALAALMAVGIQVDLQRKGDTDLPLQIPAHDESSNQDVSRQANTVRETTKIVVSGVSVLMPEEAPLKDPLADIYAPILEGTNYIRPIGKKLSQEILAKNVTRLNKESGQFEPIKHAADVIKLAGQLGDIDLVSEFGLDKGFVDALDSVSRLSIAVGIEALRDAGLPLVRHYRTTSTGKKLPERWGLPKVLAERTGIVVGSAFPGLDCLIEDVSEHVASRYAARSLKAIEELVDKCTATLDDENQKEALRKIFTQEAQHLKDEAGAYQFSRKFLFRALSMAHAQLAQTILAQGPNTQVNAACAAGPQAIGIAHDWLRQGRCDRVLVVTCDNTTSKTMLPYIGTGFLAAGAATIEAEVHKAALPFGARRNGMIVGAGAAAFVLERKEDVPKRGMIPICELLKTEFLNSAFHGTRLDVGHVATVFSRFVKELSEEVGLSVEQLAAKSFFMSHETYTPARGGSSAAEIEAIRRGFGEAASEILIANTKGFTGHCIAGSIEDLVTIKGLQRQELPPVAHLDGPGNEVDPEFKDLSFSKGGPIDRTFGIRFAAGFGSQMAMVAYQKMATSEERILEPSVYQRWVDEITGAQNLGLELVQRTLRIAEKDGVPVEQLGLPSLRLLKGPEQAPLEAVSQNTASVSPADRDELMIEVTALFSQETGYDVEYFDPAYLLEADLGIDTVKQAEIFGLLREKFGMPRDDNFKLADLQTLNDVVDYVASMVSYATEKPTAIDESNVSALASTQTLSQGKQGESKATPPSLQKDQIQSDLIDLFAEATGYEREDFDPSYQLESDLGIDTVKQAEVFSVVRQRYGLAGDDDFKLSDVQTLEAITDYVCTQLSLAQDSSTTKVQKKAPESHATVEEEASEVLAPAQGKPQVLGALDRKALMEEVIEIFAAETGYEKEDFDTSYQLEADLGIDTVKQAEVFSVLRQRYHMIQDDDFKLSDVQTLDEICTYVLKTAILDQNSKTGYSEASAPDDEEASTTSTEDLLSEVTTLFAEATGYDIDDFDQDYNLEEDLGIDTVKQAEIFSSLRQRYDLASGDDFSLSEVSTLRLVVEYVARQRRSKPTRVETIDAKEEEPHPALGIGNFKTWQVVTLPAPQDRIRRDLRDAKVIVYGDGALASDFEQELTARGADIIKFAGGASTLADVESFFRDTRASQATHLLITLDEGTSSFTAAQAYDVMEGVFFLTRAFGRGMELAAKTHVLFAGRSRGAFGEGTKEGTGVLLRSLSALAQSLAKEWVHCRCLVTDLDAGESEAAGARRALDEWLSDGPRAVAWLDGERLTLGRKAIDKAKAVPLAKGSLVVGTGGGRGVTHAILLELAKRTELNIVVVARTTGIAPEQSPLFNKNQAQQKQWAKGVLSVEGGRVTPLDVKRCIEKEECRVEVFSNLEKLRETGARVEQVQCDLGDAQAPSVLEKIRQRHGEVALVLHGAGVEESRLLKDKDDASFARVFGTKARAAMILAEALQPRKMAMMGSVVGLVGNSAQTDYAAANGFLGGLCRGFLSGGLNIGWTAWGGAGMATRGSIKQMLDEAGVEFIPLEIGARLGADLINANLEGDYLVCGELGVLGNESIAKIGSGEDDLPLPWVFDRLCPLEDGVRYHRRLTLERDPGLEHHRISGVPVLPGVLGVELMAQAALSYGQGQPYPRTVARLLDVEFKVPVKLFRDAQLDIWVHVRPDTQEGFQLELGSTFEGPNGKTIEREHFVARAVFGDERQAEPSLSDMEMARDPQISRTDLYLRYFHGEDFKVLDGVLMHGEDGIRAKVGSQRPLWFDRRPHDSFITRPWIREAGFQAAGLWEMVELSRMALPRSVESIELNIPFSDAEKGSVDVRRRPGHVDSNTFDVWVRSDSGQSYDLMRGYRSAKLRDLDEHERFEPAPPGGHAPHRVITEIADIEQSMREDSATFVSKYLSPEEQAAFAKLKVDKRRFEWLSGRVAAKRLLREVRFHSEGSIVAPSAIVVMPDEWGAPKISVVGENSSDIYLSISHAGGLAVAACVIDGQQRCGVDVEVVEKRADSFRRDYFSKKEQAWVANKSNPDLALTELWALKESVLKVLGIGARVDMRDVEVMTHNDSWMINLGGEALKRAELINVGFMLAETEHRHHRGHDVVIAQVYTTSKKRISIKREKSTTKITEERGQDISDAQSSKLEKRGKGDASS